MIDSPQAVLQTLTDAVAALRPGSAVRACAADGVGGLAVAAVGPAATLSVLPVPLLPAADEEVEAWHSADEGSVVYRTALRARDGRPLGAVVALLPHARPDEAFDAALTALAAHTAMILDAAATMMRIQEGERRRIARDLHDGLGQLLVSAYQNLQVHDYTLPLEYPRPHLTQGLSLLKEGIAETRRVMSALRLLDSVSLVDALRCLLTTIAEEAGWCVDLQTDGLTSRLSCTVETTVLRVVQEALINARKHARATRVELRLTERPGRLMVEVQDWGKGFSAVPNADLAHGRRLGLMGMHEHAALLGGTLAIHSTPSLGTRVCLTLPLPSSAAAAGTPSSVLPRDVLQPGA